MKQKELYKTAIYCRLSLDDGSLGESGSIQTQKMMLEKYCRDNNFTIKEVYIDDGYSGLNFDRPAFKRLIADIESGKINLVITKDLSRLGRDYLQTGYYTEQYFPLHNVRYIAVNDGVDTLIDNNDIAPFKNILNDMYAKDLSRKVKSAKRQRALNGLFISAQTPYGYIKDPINKNRLIVDEDIRNDIENIDWNIWNTDTTKVETANYVSFYKGVPVIKIYGLGGSMSFGIIFFDSKASYDANITAEDVLKHEYGHNVQLSNFGLLYYILYVAIPSPKVNGDNTPWELSASILGGSNMANNASNDDKISAMEYFEKICEKFKIYFPVYLL